jgi:hypothetical protein
MGKIILSRDATYTVFSIHSRHPKVARIIARTETVNILIACRTPYFCSQFYLLMDMRSACTKCHIKLLSF